MIDKIKENKFILVALAILVIYLAPTIFFPAEARYLIHDNLDSNVVWYKNLAESGKMFAPNMSIIPQSLGGIERGCYPSEFNFQHLLYTIFSPLAAYSINEVVMHFLAFFSMYVFSRRYIFKNADLQWAAAGVSLLFALLPFWPSGGAAVTAQPLLLYAFLNIFNRELNWKNWLIIAIIPLYSVLAFTNMFFVCVISVLFLLACIRKRQINFYFICALALFVVMSVIAEHRLFEMQFIEHYESHRSVLKNVGTLNFKGLIGVSLLHFIRGHHHFLCLQFPFIVLLALLALAFTKSKKGRLILIGLLALTYCISLIFVLPDWKGLDSVMRKLSFLKTFTLRFYSLFPLLWFVILAYSSWLLIAEKKIFRRLLPVVYLVMVVFTIFSVNDKDYFGSEYAENTFYNTFINKTKEGYASFSEYYKTDLFNTIKKTQKPGAYKICCIGFQPEIAQYNGFNTIDGYFYYYSKKHNELIRQIDRRELDKLGETTVGSRCYLRSYEEERGKQVIEELALDYELLKSSGTNYIFSDRKIADEHVTAEGVYDSNGDRLYTYRIK